jgi:hypothetical protein
MHNTNLFARFTSAIRNFDGNVHSPALRVGSEGRLTVQYAPFEWVNPQAKLIIVGITPGETQAIQALEEARRRLLCGADELSTKMAAKRTGGFAGNLRANLVAMLDRVGLPRWAGISSASDLFGARADLLQTASVLPYPVFVNGKRYNGAPTLLRSPMLSSMVLGQFVPVVQALPDAKLLAVGDVPWETLQWLVQEGKVDERRLLGCLPHPSAASQERVNYFLGKKPASQLSAKTNGPKIDMLRQQLEKALTPTRAI